MKTPVAADPTYGRVKKGGQLNEISQVRRLSEVRLFAATIRRFRLWVGCPID
jgi:hypothetical protein